MEKDLYKKIDIREEVPIKSFTIAAFICKKENNKGKYLQNSWQMISGKIEKGEKAWQAALREIKEETGITPDSLYSANKVEYFYEVNQNCINLVPIFVGSVENEVEVRLSDSEHNEYKWITVDESHNYLIFPNHIDIIAYLEENFIKKEPVRFLKIECT